MGIWMNGLFGILVGIITQILVKTIYGASDVEMMTLGTIVFFGIVITIGVYTTGVHTTKNNHRCVYNKTGDLNG